jgi:hypothetical protein
LVQIFSSTPCSQTPSVYVPPLLPDHVSHPYRTTGKSLHNYRTQILLHLYTNVTDTCQSPEVLAANEYDAVYAPRIESCFPSPFSGPKEVRLSAKLSLAAERAAKLLFVHNFKRLAIWCTWQRGKCFHRWPKGVMHLVFNKTWLLPLLNLRKRFRFWEQYQSAYRISVHYRWPILTKNWNQSIIFVQTVNKAFH